MQASKAAASGTAPGALEELLAAIGEQDFADLDDMSRKFVDETQARFEKYGARTMMSDKQLAWLRKIAEGGGRKEPF
jgi:DNA polymerase III delta subunit